MSKLFALSTILLLNSLVSGAQTSKWFVTVGSGYSFGGPSSSIKNKMRQAGWDDNTHNIVMFIPWAEDYPLKTYDLPFYITAGKKLKEYKSLFFTAGLTDQGKVEGFKKEGEFNWGIIGSSYGRFISVDYKEWQISAGFQYAFPDTRVKLGFGPSLLLLNTKAMSEDSSTTKQNSLVPGLVGNVRLPFGRERKLIGVELFMQTTIAPPAKMADITKSGSSDKVSLNMTSLTLGLALAMRRK